MKGKKASPRESSTVRCAIYTRKSTEEGLEQEFNSLDAQREAGEAYIKSQQHEGWVCLPQQYDDGGFTGANMGRPSLRRLLGDIEAGKIDCVVVYKVDRLSRSLLDFGRIIEAFDRHQVAFVSVTQAFNTATSMGRLILNVLLSFAQFEREMISERTRDKIAAARNGGREVRNKHNALLRGLLHCAACNCGMSHSYSQKGSKLYRYYVCQHAQANGWSACPSPSIPAGEIERFVVDHIKCIGRDPTLIRDTLAHVRRETESGIERLTAERTALARQVRQDYAELGKLLSPIRQS